VTLATTPAPPKVSAYSAAPFAPARPAAERIMPRYFQTPYTAGEAEASGPVAAELRGAAVRVIQPEK